MNKLSVDKFVPSKQNATQSQLLFAKRMEKIHKIRISNLKLLRKIAETAFNETKTTDKKYNDAMFAAYIGLSKPYFSQLKAKGSTKGLSEFTARKIEAKVDLPENWLDINHEQLDYKDVYLDGAMIKKLILLFHEFYNLESINLIKGEAINKKISNMIENAILKSSTHQNINIDDILSFFLNK